MYLKQMISGKKRETRFLGNFKDVLSESSKLIQCSNIYCNIAALLNQIKHGHYAVTIIL